MLLGFPPGSLDQPTTQNLNFPLRHLDGFHQLFILDLEGDLIHEYVVDLLFIVNHLGEQYLGLLFLLQGVLEVLAHLLLVVLNCLLIVEQHVLVLDNYLLKLTHVSLSLVPVLDRAVALRDVLYFDFFGVRVPG